MMSTLPQSAMVPPAGRLGGSLDSWLHSGPFNSSSAVAAAAAAAAAHPFFVGHSPFVRPAPPALATAAGHQSATTACGSQPQPASFAEHYMQIMSAAAAAVAVAGNGMRRSPTTILGGHLQMMQQPQQRNVVDGKISSPSQRKRRHSNVDDAYYHSADEEADNDDNDDERDADDGPTGFEVDTSGYRTQLSSQPHQLGPLDLHRSRRRHHELHRRSSDGQLSPPAGGDLQRRRCDDVRVTGWDSPTARNNDSIGSSNKSESDD